MSCFNIERNVLYTNVSSSEIIQYFKCIIRCDVKELSKHIKSGIGVIQELTDTKLVQQHFNGHDIMTTCIAILISNNPIKALHTLFDHGMSVKYLMCRQELNNPRIVPNGFYTDTEFFIFLRAKNAILQSVDHGFCIMAWARIRNRIAIFNYFQSVGLYISDSTLLCLHINKRTDLFNEFKIQPRNVTPSLFGRYFHHFNTKYKIEYLANISVDSWMLCKDKIIDKITTCRDLTILKCLLSNVILFPNYLDLRLLLKVPEFAQHILVEKNNCITDLPYHHLVVVLDNLDKKTTGKIIGAYPNVEMLVDYCITSRNYKVLNKILVHVEYIKYTCTLMTMCEFIAFGSVDSVTSLHLMIVSGLPMHSIPPFAARNLYADNGEIKNESFVADLVTLRPDWKSIPGMCIQTIEDWLTTYL